MQIIRLGKRRLLLLALSVSVITLLASLYVYRALFAEIELAAGDSADAVSIEISPGSSLNRIAQDLGQDGYLASPTLFKLWARLRGVDGSIRAGEYALERGITPAQLLNKIVRGDAIEYRITLVEGWTFERALQAIRNAENINNELAGLSLEEIALRMGLERTSPEGLLFPDTYFYRKGTSDLELLQRASERLDTLLLDAWENRLGALPYENAYEALTMASIVERESASNSERELIAAVFITRLERGMRLQSDPTVIYGMGERYQGNIRREDLSEQTPYNTYRIDGLPPTPIALSGSESIVAALRPAATDYLYFVAKGDGSHQFSRTLEEHNAAVRQYQLGIVE